MLWYRCDGSSAAGEHLPLDEPRWGRNTSTAGWLKLKSLNVMNFLLFKESENSGLARHLPRPEKLRSLKSQTFFANNFEASRQNSFWVVHVQSLNPQNKKFISDDSWVNVQFVRLKAVICQFSMMHVGVSTQGFGAIECWKGSEHKLSYGWKSCSLVLLLQ